MKHVCIILVVICFVMVSWESGLSAQTPYRWYAVYLLKFDRDKWKSKAMATSSILYFDVSSMFLQSSMTPTGRLGRLNTFSTLNQISLNFKSICK